MKKSLISIVTALILGILMLSVAMPVFADEGGTGGAVLPEGAVSAEESVEIEDPATATVKAKATAAAIVVAVVATAGAIGMAWAITKSTDGIARQPEAEGKIRTTMMLGLVFIETAIIYALVVAILIIFVL